MVVCVSEQNVSKSCERILMIISRKNTYVPRTNCLSFCEDRDFFVDSGSFSRLL